MFAFERDLMLPRRNGNVNDEQTASGSPRALLPLIHAILLHKDSFEIFDDSDFFCGRGILSN